MLESILFIADFYAGSPGCSYISSRHYFRIRFPFLEVSHSAVVYVSEIDVVPPRLTLVKDTRALTISPPNIFKSCIIIIYMYPMLCEISHYTTFHLQKTYTITCLKSEEDFSLLQQKMKSEKRVQCSLCRSH